MEFFNHQAKLLLGNTNIIKLNDNGNLINATSPEILIPENDILMQIPVSKQETLFNKPKDVVPMIQDIIPKLQITSSSLLEKNKKIIPPFKQTDILRKQQIEECTNNKLITTCAISAVPFLTAPMPEITKPLSILTKVSNNSRNFTQPILPLKKQQPIDSIVQSDNLLKQAFPEKKHSWTKYPVIMPNTVAAYRENTIESSYEPRLKFSAFDSSFIHKKIENLTTPLVPPSFNTTQFNVKPSTNISSINCDKKHFKAVMPPAKSEAINIKTQETPAVKITIGRLKVQSSQTRKVTKHDVAAKRKSHMSLKDYLNRNHIEKI